MKKSLSKSWTQLAKLHAKTLAMYASIFLFLSGAYFFAQLQYNKYADEDIRDTVVAFYIAVNAHDYETARAFMTKGRENDAYITNLQTKMQALNISKVGIYKIYPALVNNNLAAIGYILDAQNKFETDKPTDIKEFAVRLMVKEGSDWKFASKETLAPYKTDEIDNMLELYKEIVHTSDKNNN